MRTIDLEIWLVIARGDTYDEHSTCRVVECVDVYDAQQQLNKLVLEMPTRDDYEEVLAVRWKPSRGLEVIDVVWNRVQPLSARQHVRDFPPYLVKACLKAVDRQLSDWYAGEIVPAIAD